VTARNVARRGVARHGMGGPADVRRPASPAEQPTELPDAVERDVRRVLAVMRRVARNEFVAAKLTAHQLAYLLAEEREVLFTGSGGCGKSVGLLAAALLDVDRPGYRALLVQRTLAGPVNLTELARQWLEPSAAQWDSSARVWRFPSDATLGFGHERLLYVAGEYHFVGLDDATLFADHEYRRLFQVWRRRQGSTVPMRVRVATSPGGPGHDWVRERFAIDNPASVLPLGRRTITARMGDNEHLDVAEYRRSLANLDPVRRAQLETGDWSIRQGGAIFQRQWFRIVDRAPAGLRRVRFWDLAATAEPTRTDLLYDPDYTVGALLGQAHDGTVYVLDVVRRRLDPHDVKRLVRQTAELDGREVVVGMEQESGASGKSVIADYRRILAGFVFQPRQPFADKVTRAAPYASYAEGGGVRLVRAPWNAAFLQEHEQFPLGEHDDVPDACSSAFNLMFPDAAAAANPRNRRVAHFNPWGSGWAAEETES
jgi:predicted phage terminase large subunit-like protein